ncbi:hypothetical protein H4S08_001553 [Coemansia sp. RSA 1365]|nr:hypothetical protein H4S08_001553 [Coemansia sp. RSA 1365]
MASNNDRIRAVIFDIGGVVVKSPFIAISVYEREHRLPANYINVALSKKGARGAFQQYERGEINYEEFVDLWTDELNEVEQNNAAYRQYLQRRNLDVHMVLPQETEINGSVLFAQMMELAHTPNDCVVELIRWLRSRGYRVAALTNNFKNDPVSGIVRNKLLVGLFDEFVESSVVGLRKPKPKFYLHVCNLLEIRPSEAIFLDDIGINLRAAKALGMTPIQVEIGKELDAVEAVKSIIHSCGALSPKI